MSVQSPPNPAASQYLVLLHVELGGEGAGDLLVECVAVALERNESVHLLLLLELDDLRLVLGVELQLGGRNVPEVDPVGVEGIPEVSLSLRVEQAADDTHVLHELQLVLGFLALITHVFLDVGPDVSLLEGFSELGSEGALDDGDLVDVAHDVAIGGEDGQGSPADIGDDRVHLAEVYLLQVDQDMEVAAELDVLEGGEAFEVLGTPEGRGPVEVAVQVHVLDVWVVGVVEGSGRVQTVDAHYQFRVGRHVVQPVQGELESCLGLVLGEVGHVEDGRVLLLVQIAVKVLLESGVFHLFRDVPALEHQVGTLPNSIVHSLQSVDEEFFLRVSHRVETGVVAAGGVEGTGRPQAQRDPVVSLRKVFYVQSAQSILAERGHHDSDEERSAREALQIEQLLIGERGSAIRFFAVERQLVAPGLQQNVGVVLVLGLFPAESVHEQVDTRIAYDAHLSLGLVDGVQGDEHHTGRVEPLLAQLSAEVEGRVVIHGVQFGKTCLHREELTALPRVHLHHCLDDCHVVRQETGSVDVEVYSHALFEGPVFDLADQVLDEGLVLLLLVLLLLLQLVLALRHMHSVLLVLLLVLHLLQSVVVVLTLLDQELYLSGTLLDTTQVDWDAPKRRFEEVEGEGAFCDLSSFLLVELEVVPADQFVLHAPKVALVVVRGLLVDLLQVLRLRLLHHLDPHVQVQLAPAQQLPEVTQELVLLLEHNGVGALCPVELIL